MIKLPRVVVMVVIAGRKRCAEQHGRFEAMHSSEAPARRKHHAAPVILCVNTTFLPIQTAGASLAGCNLGTPAHTRLLSLSTGYCRFPLARQHLVVLMYSCGARMIALLCFG
jgi:hypothetical protein